MNKVLTLIVTLSALALGSSQDEIVGFDEVAEIETGWLICVPENNRNNLVDAGFPSESIFYWKDKRTNKHHWCVVWRDNSAEVFTEGLTMLAKSIGDAVMYALEFVGGNGRVVSAAQRADSIHKEPENFKGGIRHYHVNSDWVECHKNFWNVDEGCWAFDMQIYR